MRFTLKAVDTANQVVALQLEASDEAAAASVARQRGYSVLSLAPSGARFWSPARRKRRFDTTLFAIEMLALLDAGLNVVEALQALAEKQATGEQRTVLASMLEAVHRGQSFSQALEGLPEVFSALYVATVRSSEKTGNLRDALSRYVAYEEEFDRVRRKLASALIYPAILAVVGTLVFCFLMLYVVPRFARVYEEISAELPLFSSVLLHLGRWVDDHRYLVTLAVGALFSVAAYLLSSARHRRVMTAALARIPAVGDRMRIYQLARFYRTTGMLLRAGIPALQAFRMAKALLPDPLRNRLDRATALLQEGRSISSALASAGLSTPLAARMMAVGEKSGRMGELMERIARFYDDETARFVDACTRVFEPVLMAGLGLAVGAVVVLMYMPIFELAGSIK